MRDLRIKIYNIPQQVTCQSHYIPIPAESLQEAGITQ